MGLCYCDLLVVCEFGWGVYLTLCLCCLLILILLADCWFGRCLADF